jgi:hypothetical protein
VVRRPLGGIWLNPHTFQSSPGFLLLSRECSSAAFSPTHAPTVFADHPVASYVRIVRGVRAIGDRVALLHAIVGMVPPGQDDLRRSATPPAAARRLRGFRLARGRAPEHARAV